MPSRLRVSVAVLIFVCMTVASCSRSQGGDTIAVFTKNQTNPFFQSVRLGADNAAKQMQVAVTHYIPTKPDSIPEQMSQIEDAIIKRPSAIVFIPVDSKAMVPGVLKMNAANIPVINIVDHSTGGQVASYVGSNEHDIALMTGRYLFKHMNGQGSVIIIEGVRGSLGALQRTQGFQEAVAEFPGVKLLASQPGNFQRLQALQVMENLLQSYPRIDAVLAANDAMAMGVIEALDAANRKAVVASMNGTKEAVDAIKAGKLLASGDFNGYQQGCFGVLAAVRAMRKLPVPPEVAFPPRMIDSTNYKAVDVPDAERTCPAWDTVVKG